MAKIEENKYLVRKNFSHRAILIWQNEDHLLSTFQEKYNFFLSIFAFLAKKGTGSHVQGTKANFETSYFTNTITEHLLFSDKFVQLEMSLKVSWKQKK